MGFFILGDLKMVQKRENEWFELLYNANVIDVCNALGIELQKEGRVYRGVEHDSLVITPNKNSWKWNSRDIGGRGGWAFIKDYVLDDSDNHLPRQQLVGSMKKYAAELTGANVGTFSNDSLPTTDDKREPYAYPKHHIVDHIIDAEKYLSTERKLDPVIVDWLHGVGVLDQDKMDNVIFVERNLCTNAIIGSVKQGTHVDFKKYGKRGTAKQIDKNSEPYAAWIFKTGKPENVRFFESPIDAISYYQLLRQSSPNGGKDYIFISMNGLKKQVISKYLTEVDAFLNGQFSSGIKSIALCVDNDEAGRKFAADQKKYVFTNNRNQTVEIKDSLPTTEKDWNDVLKKSSLEKNPIKTNALEQEQEKEKDKPKDIVKTPINDLMQAVSQDFKDPIKTLDLLDFLNKFHGYSLRNRLLIEQQRKGAVAVASFSKFKELGYSVKKGEKALKIIVPIKKESFIRNGKAIPVKYATATEKKQIKAGTIKVQKDVFFTHGNVFDVSQTNMPKEKYPELYPNRHLDFDMTNPNDKNKIDNQLDKFAASIGFKVNRDISNAEYSEHFGNAKGVTLQDSKTIYLNPNNTPTEMTTTTMHELGHAQLHFSPEGRTLSRDIKELQAQLTSYLVAQRCGIDNREYTVHYIANWTDKGKKLEKLEPEKQSQILAGVTQAADKMADYIISAEQPEKQIIQEKKHEQSVQKQKELSAKYQQQQKGNHELENEQSYWRTL